MLKKIAIAAACLVTVTAGPWAVRSARQMPAKGTPHHERIMEDLGTWTAEGKLMLPGMPAMKFSANEVNTKLGEYWVLSTFEGDMMGLPFEGRATAGYDPNKKQYVGTWIDNMNPGLAVMTGSSDDDGVITWHWEQFDAMMGRVMKYKSVNRHLGDGKRSFHSFTVADDGTETPAMEIVYTRADD